MHTMFTINQPFYRLNMQMSVSMAMKKEKNHVEMHFGFTNGNFGQIQ